jgi:hypothetical protein
MKSNKFFATALLAIVLGSSTFVSCQKEQDATVANQKTEVRAFAENLYALGRNGNATPEQTAQYQKAMKNLTFEQSEAFLQVVYEKGLAAAKNNDATLQEVERFHAIKKELNKQAMTMFKKSYMTLESAQLDEVEKAVYTQLGFYDASKGAPNGKVAVPVEWSCAFATFPAGAPYTTNLNDARVSTNWMWVDNDTDWWTPCDCQFAFATTDPRYDRSGSRDGAAQAILQQRSPGRRIVTSGVSAGTYLVVGTSQLTAYSTCNDFGVHLRLVD